MRDHVLNCYNIDINIFEFKYRLRNVNDKKHIKKNVYNYSSFSFMNYAMIQFSIFDKKFTFCLNIKKNVFFCDRRLLLKNVYRFIHKIRFIIIITKIINMQQCKKYIEKKMFLNFCKIVVRVKTYLIKNFKFDFIIDMNVLNKNDIDFLFTRQILKIKNIEIFLYYVSSSSSKIFTLYYFVVVYTNENDVISSNIHKWNFNFNFMFDVHIIQ